MAAGSSAKLVIDTARFMPFRAQNVQSTKRNHFIVLRLALLGKLLVNRLPLVDGSLKNFALVLEQNHRNGRRSRFAVRTLRIRSNHRGRLCIWHRQTIFQEMLTRHGFRISAQQDVCSAASHVRCHSDRAFSPGLCHNSRLALVLLGVQHFVRDSRLFQNVRNGFRFFDGNRSHKHGLPTLVIVANSVRE